MKIIYTLLSITFSLVFFSSCLSEQAQKIRIMNLASKAIIDNSTKTLYSLCSFDLYGDSVVKKWAAIPYDSAELRMKFAKKFESYVKELSIKHTLKNEKEAAQHEKDAAQRAKDEAKAEKEFNKSTAGKILKKHPNWSKEDCIKLADREIWIGMSIGMLHYLRGLPEHVNKSDYGNGIQYQWCWTELSPSCFYGGEDGIITAYN